uniref:Cell wall protein n=1 Tax=Panagrellus redivivus TaxID=6233 RepID=A0A7E4ZWA6_PANRE
MGISPGISPGGYPRGYPLRIPAYTDPLLDLSKSPLLKYLNEIAGYNVLGFEPPNVDYLGYFPQYNHTADENYVSYTGKDDYHKMGLVKSWANSSSLGWWNSDLANDLDGTSDGTSFGGFVDKEKNSHIRNFQSFIGRILPMDFSHEDSVDNIKSFNYKIDDDMYNTTREVCYGYEVVNELNTTYFPDYAEKNGLNSFGNVAFPPGVIQQINFPGKKKRIPFFVTLSAPHFYNAHETVINTVDGLSPSKELHNLGSWQIQPTVGSTLKATFRMQTSVAVFDSEHFALLNKIRPSLVPAFWLEVNVNLKSYALDYIKMSTKTIPLIVRIVGIVLTALAVVIAVAVCLAVCFRRRKRVPKIKGIVSYA